MSRGGVPRRRAPVHWPHVHGVLHPAVALAARRAGADTVALVDVGSSGLNLVVDRVAVTYSDGTVLGDRSSPVHVRCRLAKGRPVPTEPFPRVVARVVATTAPFDPTSAEDARRTLASLAPDDPDARARLEAELALTAADPPRLVRGRLPEALAAALAGLLPGALPVVITTWALSRLRAERRERFLRVLDEAAVDRPVAWVSVEGVGVAPGVPTLGDRPASGHSIVGLASFGLPRPRVEAVGRCWSRGAVLEWLAGG